MTIEPLDYDRHPIWLHVTSEAERTMRIRSCDKEPEYVAWIESLPAGVVFDIGANVGSHSLIAAANGHQAYAFEPPGPTFDRLEENLLLNQGLKVFAYPVLLGDENGPVAFSYSSLDPGAALHSLGASGPHVETLPMSSLDVYVASRNIPYPDYIKCDVDGAELRILVGAEVCLNHAKSILIEVDPGSPMSDRIQPFLEYRGFRKKSEHLHEGSGVSNVRFDRGQ